ncbi:hypothetical protein RRG08_060418 [Elysia crispata]|uniref:Uncharacterized protein n=1 Tax=Elysia crispata TaxID=231223 RepID=A0AAE1ALQ3_9GAST|nr:hypothetical protein RRG08_060418 [Elysia crispata]
MENILSQTVTRTKQSFSSCQFVGYPECTVPSTSFTMKTLLIVCLGAIILASVTADKPACKSGGYYDCSDLQYTSDYQTGVYYCCADADLRPVLAGTLGTASLTCSCYTTAEYCAEKPYDCP